MLNRSKIAVGLVAALSVSALGGVAFAATDGDLGSTSTGTSSINATVTSLVLIDDVNDISLTAATAANPLAGSDSICVYSNAASNVYEITASSANGSGSFLVSDGGSNTMAYTVTWTDQDTTSSVLTEGVQSSSSFNGSGTTDCTSSGGPSSVALSIPAGTWTTSPAGTYTDTLTLVVAPN